MNEIEILFRTHYGRMLLLAKLMLKDEEEARDVVSDVFERVLTMPSERITQAYLLVAVRNSCIDRIRQWTAERQEKALLSMAVREEFSCNDISEHERQKRIDDIEHFIDTRLAPRTQRIVRMRYTEKRKYNDISEELNISRVAVYKHLQKAITKLKQQFNP